jgi:hypothetical protein
LPGCIRRLYLNAMSCATLKVRNLRVVNQV